MKFYAYINSSDSLSEICTQKFFTSGELFSLSHNVAPDLVNPSDLLILNIDPFSLFSFNVSVIEKVNCPKVAIICDTHHGILPLSRSIAFCLRLSIKTVILRFNQRHKSWFESFGISCYCTLLSPDLFNYINNHGFISPFSQPDRTNKLLSVGRLSPAHKYRYQILSNISQDSELTSVIDHKNTATFTEMIDLLYRYSFSFNASLNLDFNRRLIESTIAGTICISDSLESLQFSGFFEIFKESILWYDDINQLKNIISSSYGEI